MKINHGSDHRNVSCRVITEKIVSPLTDTVTFSSVAVEDSIHPVELAFEPPYQDLAAAAGTKGFRHIWEKLTYAFALPDPTQFPAISGIPADDMDVLEKYVAGCRKLGGQPCRRTRIARIALAEPGLFNQPGGRQLHPGRVRPVQDRPAGLLHQPMGRRAMVEPLLGAAEAVTAEVEPNRSQHRMRRIANQQSLDKIGAICVSGLLVLNEDTLHQRFLMDRRAPVPVRLSRICHALHLDNEVFGQQMMDLRLAEQPSESKRLPCLWQVAVEPGRRY